MIVFNIKSPPPSPPLLGDTNNEAGPIGTGADPDDVKGAPGDQRSVTERVQITRSQTTVSTNHSTHSMGIKV